MGPLLVVVWLVIVLPALIFAGGYLTSMGLNLAVHKLSRPRSAGSETSDTSDPEGK